MKTTKNENINKKLNKKPLDDLENENAKLQHEQISFFNEAEINQKPEAEEPCLEKITYERSKKRGVNKASFENLEIERIEYSLSEDEQICKTCDSKINEMSTEIRKELKIVPAKVSITHTVRKIYVCKSCNESGDKTPIVRAPMPEPVLKGSFA